MKIYNNLEELQKDVVDNNFIMNDDITIAFNLNYPGLNINAGDINAWDIKARDINAENIKAGDINALDIKAGDINAWNINALGIDARDIQYYAVCVAYRTFSCTSIRGRRENSKHFCLDGEIVFKQGDEK